jgi:NADH:ubiquinone reductase (H+-translocating)
MKKQKVVIVGAGFGGIAAAESIAKISDCEITLIDRRNFHLFQPLLYQVAMAGLNPSDITVPLRTLFRRQKNINVLMGEVDKIDFEKSQVHFSQRFVDYNYLVLCCGSQHGYFGHDEWEQIAPGLKNLEQATEIRSRILTAFELAEVELEPVKQKTLLTFVVVGGGPTGVELAGAIAEMASCSLLKDYRNADLSKTKVVLVEAGPRVLAAFPEKLSAVAQKNLEDLGVEVRVSAKASELSSEGLKVGDEFIGSKTIIWAAGVFPSGLTSQIPGAKDSLGRAVVLDDLSLPGYKNVFVIGDQSGFLGADGVALPGIAPVAVQQGQFLGRVLESDIKSKPRPNFKYFDKGIMATIGRSKAVVSTMGINFSGWFAWLTWVFVHVIYLMRFKNRFFVLLQWAWSYFTFGQGARLITYKNWKFYGEKSKPPNSKN